MTHVLHEPFSSERRGLTLCLAETTGIGPRTSPDPDEWMRFDSREAAAHHPAAFHSLTFYEPKPLAALQTQEEADA